MLCIGISYGSEKTRQEQERPDHPEETQRDDKTRGKTLTLKQNNKVKEEHEEVKKEERPT
jgi:hypothetical protein